MSNQIISFPLPQSNFNMFLIAFYSSSLAMSAFHLHSCKLVFSISSFSPWVFLSIKSGQSFIAAQAFFYLGQRSIICCNW